MSEKYILDSLKPSDFVGLQKIIKTGLDYPYFYGKSPLRCSFEYVAATLVYNHRNVGPLFHAIRQKETQELIGCVVLIPNSKDPSCAEIGCFIHPSFQNKGIATQATQEVVQKAINDKWLKSLFATAHPDNLASRKILEKLGLRTEGPPQISKYKERDGKTFAKRLIFKADASSIKRALGEQIHLTIITSAPQREPTP